MLTFRLFFIASEDSSIGRIIRKTVGGLQFTEHGLSSLQQYLNIISVASERNTISASAMVCFFLQSLLLCAILGLTKSFRQTKISLSSTRLHSHGVHDDGKVAANSHKGNSVSVYKSADELGLAVCNDFVLSAQNAISRSGRFYVAVPGGSVLKMLGGLKSMQSCVDWSKVHLFYVNHKCVPNDDASATHFKALSIFLDACPCVAYSMAAAPAGMTKGHDTDAHLYRAQMEAILPQHEGLPIFDYMLLGMGKDGHIGSLYPGRKEVLMTDSHQWVLSVDKKSPSSISLSLPVMNAARYYTAPMILLF